MKEFVLCLCLLFMQFPKPETSIIESDIIHAIGIRSEAENTVLNPSDEKIKETKDYFLNQFEYLEKEIKTKSFISFRPLDYFFYETTIHLKNESYKNPDPDYYSEYTHQLIPKCEEHDNKVCIIWDKKTDQDHSQIDAEFDSFVESIIEDMEREKKDSVPFDVDYTLEKRGGEFVFYPVNPFAYTFYQKKKEFIKNLKKF